MSDSLLFPERDRIVVGEPLPFSIYNADRKLLLAAGRIVDSERMREMLLKSGMYRGAEDDPEAIDDAAGKDTIIQRRRAGSVNAPLASAQLALLQRDFGAMVSSHPFSITMASSETRPAYTAYVLGIHEQSMILTAPVQPDGMLVMIAPGEEWLCRTFQVTSVFRFRAKVLKTMAEPFPHLHLELPKRVERRKVRGGPRANVFVHAQITGPKIPGSGSAPCVVLDLAVGGGRIGVEKHIKLERGQALMLAFKIELLGHHFDLSLKSTVASVSGPSDARHPNVAFYGLRFSGLSSLETLALHGFVTGHLTEELNSFWQVLSAASAEEVASL